MNITNATNTVINNEGMVFLREDNRPTSNSWSTYLLSAYEFFKDNCGNLKHYLFKKLETIPFEYLNFPYLIYSFEIWQKQEDLKTLPFHLIYPPRFQLTGFPRLKAEDLDTEIGKRILPILDNYSYSFGLPSLSKEDILRITNDSAQRGACFGQALDMIRLFYENSNATDKELYLNLNEKNVALFQIIGIIPAYISVHRKEFQISPRVESYIQQISQHKSEIEKLNLQKEQLQQQVNEKDATIISIDHETSSSLQSMQKILNIRHEINAMLHVQNQILQQTLSLQQHIVELTNLKTHQVATEIEDSLIQKIAFLIEQWLSHANVSLSITKGFIFYFTDTDSQEKIFTELNALIENVWHQEDVQSLLVTHSYGEARHAFTIQMRPCKRIYDQNAGFIETPTLSSLQAAARFYLEKRVLPALQKHQQPFFALEWFAFHTRNSSDSES